MIGSDQITVPVRIGTMVQDFGPILIQFLFDLFCPIRKFQKCFSFFHRTNYGPNRIRSGDMFRTGLFRTKYGPTVRSSLAFNTALSFLNHWYHARNFIFLCCGKGPTICRLSTIAHFTCFFIPIKMSLNQDSTNSTFQVLINGTS